MFESADSDAPTHSVFLAMHGDAADPPAAPSLPAQPCKVAAQTGGSARDKAARKGDRNATQRSAMQYNTTQRSAAQRSATQDNATQYKTTRRRFSRNVQREV